MKPEVLDPRFAVRYFVDCIDKDVVERAGFRIDEATATFDAIADPLPESRQVIIFCLSPRAFEGSYSVDRWWNDRSTPIEHDTFSVSQIQVWRRNNYITNITSMLSRRYRDGSTCLQTGSSRQLRRHGRV